METLELTKQTQVLTINLKQELNSIWYVLSTSRIRAGHTATQFPILPGGHDKDS